MEIGFAFRTLSITNLLDMGWQFTDLTDVNKPIVRAIIGCHPFGRGERQALAAYPSQEVSTASQVFRKQRPGRKSLACNCPFQLDARFNKTQQSFEVETVTVIGYHNHPAASLEQVPMTRKRKLEELKERQRRLILLSKPVMALKELQDSRSLSFAGGIINRADVQYWKKKLLVDEARTTKDTAVANGSIKHGINY